MKDWNEITVSPTVKNIYLLMRTAGGIGGMLAVPEIILGIMGHTSVILKGVPCLFIGIALIFITPALYALADSILESHIKKQFVETDKDGRWNDDI